MATPAIRFEGLTKRYGRTVGVDGLDLEIHAGEVFGYLGPNGAGKTTTIRLLLDLIRPTAGRAEVLGLDSRRDSIEIQRRVGYLPGELALYGQLTGRSMLRHLGNLRGGVPDRSFEVLADRFDLDLERKVSQLSTGNRQKIGVVQAFMHRPELLILDEPTVGLDPLLQNETYGLIHEARDKGRTVFLSSHILPEVERIADRVGIIRDGRLIEVESIENLKARAVRMLEIHFGHPMPGHGDLEAVPGIRSVRTDRNVVHIEVEGSVDALVKALGAWDVATLRSRESDLEEIFLAMYREAGHG